ncbi:MAG: LysR family transcriptional regulator [Gammaproteobacteria bacterium]|nr:MAG: LysR family transcriptional regulator [Gammaproteobacteria bacterium]
MDVSDFKTFLEVARTRHFGQAAKNLCITQSTVSARIKTLEDQLGTALFVRQRNNIQLTRAGEKLLPHAELIAATWNRVRQDIAIEGGQHQSLVIGGVPDLWDQVLQQWLQHIYSAHQSLIIYAEAQLQGTLVNRLITGTMDLAFLHDAPQNDQLITRHLLDLPLVLVSSNAQPLHDAIAEKYILVDWGSSFLTQHAQHFSSLPTPEMQVNEARIALDFILACGGSAYVAEPLVAALLQTRRLFQVEDAPVFHRPVYAVYNKSSAKQAFLETLLTSVSSSPA